MSKYFDDVMRGLRALDKSQLQEVRDKVEEYIEEEEKREDKWNIAKDQNAILMELKIEYEDRKAPSIIRREEEHI